MDREIDVLVDRNLLEGWCPCRCPCRNETTSVYHRWSDLIGRDRRFDGASLRIRGWTGLRARPDATEFRGKRTIILQRVLKESLHARGMPRRNKGWNGNINTKKTNVMSQGMLTLNGVDGEGRIYRDPLTIGNGILRLLPQSVIPPE